MNGFRSVDEALLFRHDGVVQFSLYGERTRLTIFNYIGNIADYRDSESGVAGALGTYDVHFGKSVDDLLAHDDVATVSFYQADVDIVCSIEAANLLELARGAGLYANDALKAAVAAYAETVQ